MAHFTLGYVYQMGYQQNDEAIDAYLKAIKYQPSLPNSYLNLAGLYLERQRFEEAIRMYSKSIQLSPQSVAAYLGRGKAYLSTGKRQQACTDFKRAADSGMQEARLRLRQYCQ